MATPIVWYNRQLQSANSTLHNLLRPAGVQLQPSTFQLNLYRAEDIPRMDSAFLQGVKKLFGSGEQKELVDPYFIFSFAGKQEGNIQQVQIGIKAKLPTPELAQLLMSLLEQLVSDCRKPMSLPQSGRHVENNLDKLLRTYRKEELQMIIESARVLRENATDINEALGEVESILQQLKILVQEPQNSMPDVILWMISGEKRIAYYRIPANDLLYSTNPDYIGKHCGKVQSIQLKIMVIELHYHSWSGLAVEGLSLSADFEINPRDRMKRTWNIQHISKLRTNMKKLLTIL